MQSTGRPILFLSFDLDVDSAEAYRKADPVARSRGRFAARRGLGKVLAVLSRYSVKTTFFVPGWVAENYPELIERITNAGHEVAGHGYMHERLDELDWEAENKVFHKMVKEIERRTGKKPLGFRAPYWRWSTNTLGFIASYGIMYDSSLMDDEEPYIIEHRGRRIVELPVDWRLDDWPYLEYYRSLTPRELLDMWIDELAYALETRGYVALTMHPQCIGRGSRIKVLESILRYALDHGFWLPRGTELAKAVLRGKG